MLNDTELRNPWKSMKTQRTMSMTVEAWEATRQPGKQWSHQPI